MDDLPRADCLEIGHSGLVGRVEAHQDGLLRHLTDFEWRVIEPLLPNKPRGVPRADDRRVLNGIFWALRFGASWRDLPECYGPRITCYNRFRAMAKGRRLGSDDGHHHRGARWRHPGDRQHLRPHSPARRDRKKGVQTTVSVDHAADSQPRSALLSTRKASQSDSA